jgi:UDP-N-acetylmuramate--alanine ligase
VDLKSVHNIYFIGIGGIGMSAIARYLHSMGKSVSGYDKTSTSLTKKLESEGIDIHYDDDVNLIDASVELVIYTPAIPGSHKELTWFRANGYPVIKRAQALGMISRDSKAIAVAGTHGKTSTSSMVTQLLTYGDIAFSAFVGGIILDVESNYVYHGNEWVVLEADEYDRSFLQLNPEIAILISMDADHLDIYDDVSTMHEGFWHFVEKINPGGFLIFQSNLEQYFPEGWKGYLESHKVTTIPYGLKEGAAQGKNVRVENGQWVMDYSWKDHRLDALILPMPGHHNAENATAAITAALITGVQESAIRMAYGSFSGIHRRFEKLYDDGKVIYIDDYAHHPTELKAAISAARTMYPAKRLTGIFQPHLFTRTRDFVEGFAEALDTLDEVILMDIYPARELPIEGVTTEIILRIMKNKNAWYIKDEEVIDQLMKIKPEVIITLGAGDIDLLRDKIVKELKERSS